MRAWRLSRSSASITGNKTAQVVEDRFQPHVDLGFRLALGPAFMASILNTVDYKKVLETDKVCQSCSQLRLPHDDVHITTAPASVQEHDLCSAVDDTIECSFETSDLPNSAVPRAAQGP